MIVCNLWVAFLCVAYVGTNLNTLCSWSAGWPAALCEGRFAASVAAAAPASLLSRAWQYIAFGASPAVALAASSGNGAADAQRASSSFATIAAAKLWHWLIDASMRFNQWLSLIIVAALLVSCFLYPAAILFLVTIFMLYACFDALAAILAPFVLVQLLSIVLLLYAYDMEKRAPKPLHFDRQKLRIRVASAALTAIACLYFADAAIST